MLRRLLGPACLLVHLAAGSALAGGAKPQERPKDWPRGRLEWRDLFNGADLGGWSLEGKGRWSVEEGCIVGRQDATTHGESWLLTDEAFGDFILLVKFQVSKGGNSGVFFRVPKVRGHPGRMGYEMQVWDADRRNPTGSIYGVAKGPLGLHRAGEWNQAMIACVGDSMFTAINGRVAVATNSRRSLRGRIGFQVHGGVRYASSVVRYKDVWLAPVVAPKPARGDVAFKKIRLDDGINEGAAVFDVDRDGKLDILCGHQWYESPTWRAHPVRRVRTAAYAESFYELPFDVNGDGWTDIIAGGGFASKEHWYENPRRPGSRWPAREYLTRRSFIEDMVILDLDDDGMVNDLLPNGNGPINWIRIIPGAQPDFVVRDLGKRGTAHGIGYGDVNGDQRIDIITPHGWYEAPTEPAKRRWTWHREFKLKGRPGVPIRTLDVNGDRKPDIIYGDGHGYGLWWLEQGADDQGKRTWTEHLIDDSFSQAHYIELGDINGDGRTDIVTGKRWRAHNGRDPGGNEPTCLFWFEHDGSGARWTRHVIDYNGGAGCGMGLVVVDIDGDGDIDVVAPGKGGLYLFLNQS